MKILVTGGAGFIGSAVVRHAVRAGHSVINLDALTYAANLANVAPVANSPLYVFEHADIRDRAALDRIFVTHEPDAVMHLAAESHVDRSHRRAGRFHRNEHHRHLQPAGSRPRTLDAKGQARGLPFSPHLDRRGLRLARRGRAVHRRHALCTEFALFGLKGCQRPSGARLARNLRPAGAGDELFEQLRPLPLSRKADPGGDPERARGRADSGLRNAARTCATGFMSRITPMRC